MSTHRRAVGHVASWEFRRYVKPKQQLVGFVITLLMLAGGAWIGRLGDDDDAIELAVVGAERLPTLAADAGRFALHARDSADLPALLAEVEAEDRDAVLVIDGDGRGTLHTRHEPGWRDELERELTVAAQVDRFGRSGVPPERVAEITAPFALDVREAAPRAGRAERVAALVAVGLAIIGIFSGIGYVFSSVTGEKQNRLSEQIISTIPPQAWIDGKIIGLAGVALVAVLNFVVAFLGYLLIAKLLWDSPLPALSAIQNPGLMLATLVFVSLGFLFWFAFLTACAAIIDDPHSSTRTQLLFIPMLAFVPAFIGIPDPDATWVRVLSVLPPTSAGVMPVRMLVAEVPIVEVVGALALLLGAIWLARRAAGKVFRLGMLMYGKEPTWGEVRRWIRER